MMAALARVVHNRQGAADPERNRRENNQQGALHGDLATAGPPNLLPHRPNYRGSNEPTVNARHLQANNGAPHQLRQLGEVCRHAAGLVAVSRLVAERRCGSSSSKYKWPSACPLASLTMKLPACSLMVHGGGKRRAHGGSVRQNAPGVTAGAAPGALRAMVQAGRPRDRCHRSHAAQLAPGRVLAFGVADNGAKC